MLVTALLHVVLMVTFCLTRDEALPGTMVRLGSASTMIHLLTTGYEARVSTTFGTLRSVLGAALLSVIDTRGIKTATDDVVLDARQILHSPSAY